MRNVAESVGEVQPHPLSHPTRVFLGRFPQQQRGPICNLCLAPVRAGVHAPEKVVKAVSSTVFPDLT